MQGTATRRTLFHTYGGCGQRLLSTTTKRVCNKMEVEIPSVLPHWIGGKECVGMGCGGFFEKRYAPTGEVGLFTSLLRILKSTEFWFATQACEFGILDGTNLMRVEADPRSQCTQPIIFKRSPHVPCGAHVDLDDIPMSFFAAPGLGQLPCCCTGKLTHTDRLNSCRCFVQCPWQGGKRSMHACVQLKRASGFGQQWQGRRGARYSTGLRISLRKRTRRSRGLRSWMLASRFQRPWGTLAGWDCCVCWLVSSSCENHLQTQNCLGGQFCVGQRGYYFSCGFCVLDLFSCHCANMPSGTDVDWRGSTKSEGVH